MSSQGLENANYLRRVFDRKLDKADPKLSFHKRIEAAMCDMDAEFGSKWRNEMTADGVTKLPDSGQGIAPPLQTSQEAEGFFSKMQEVGDKEGLGPPPDSLREDDEVAKPETSKQQPLIIVIQNRMDPKWPSRTKKQTSSPLTRI